MFFLQRPAYRQARLRRVYHGCQECTRAKRGALLFTHSVKQTLSKISRLQHRPTGGRIEPALEHTEVKVRKIGLNRHRFMPIFEQALEALPPLRDYDHCPKCGHAYVRWDPERRKHRCWLEDCDWEEEAESLPLRNPTSGGALSPGEIITMVLKEFERGR